MSSCKQCCTIAQDSSFLLLKFSVAEDLGEISMGINPSLAAKYMFIRKNLQLLTNNLIYLKNGA